MANRFRVEPYFPRGRGDRAAGDGRDDGQPCGAPRSSDGRHNGAGEAGCWEAYLMSRKNSGGALQGFARAAASAANATTAFTANATTTSSRRAAAIADGSASDGWRTEVFRRRGLTTTR